MAQEPQIRRIARQATALMPISQESAETEIWHKCQNACEPSSESLSGKCFCPLFFLGGGASSEPRQQVAPKLTVYRLPCILTERFVRHPFCQRPRSCPCVAWSADRSGTNISDFARPNFLRPRYPNGAVNSLSILARGAKGQWRWPTPCLSPPKAV